MSEETEISAEAKAAAAFEYNSRLELYSAFAIAGTLANPCVVNISDSLVVFNAFSFAEEMVMEYEKRKRPTK